MDSPIHANFPVVTTEATQTALASFNLTGLPLPRFASLPGGRTPPAPGRDPDAPRRHRPGRPRLGLLADSARVVRHLDHASRVLARAARPPLRAVLACET